MGTDDLRAAAEAILCAATGAASVTRLCPHCGSSRHGRPRLVGSGLSASISYAGDLVVVAWGPGRVGIDIELISARPDVPDLLGWTRLEALAKAAGTGLRDWPQVPVPEDLATRELRLPDGYVGTVAGETEVRIAGADSISEPSAPTTTNPWKPLGLGRQPFDGTDGLGVRRL